MNEQKVEFKVGKDTLRGTLFIPDGKGSFPGVVFFHGSGGVGEVSFETAKLLSGYGILGFAFNYRGAGLSEGSFENQTIKMGIADGKTAVDFFLSVPQLNKNRLGFAGVSFGGYVSSTLCNSYNVKSFALNAPAAYTSSSLNNQRNADTDLEKDFEKSKSYEEIKKYRGDLLVSICEFDDVLPKGMAEEYFNRAINVAKKEKYIIKGAGHRLSIDPPRKKDYQNKVIDWFSKTL